LVITEYLLSKINDANLFIHFFFNSAIAKEGIMLLCRRALWSFYAFTLFAMPLLISSCYNPDRLYVSNLGDGTISIIDRNDLSSLGDVFVGGEPAHIGMIAAIDRAYVCDLASNNIHVINTFTNTKLTDITINRPAASLDIDPNLQLIYALDNSGTNLQVIDVTSNIQIADKLIGSDVQDIRLDALNGRIFITDFIEGLIVADSTDYSVSKTIPFDGKAHGLAVDSISSNVYVTDVEKDMVVVINPNIDPPSDPVLAKINVGSQPEWVAINASGTKAYVTNAGDGTVSVIDAVNYAETKSIPVKVGVFYIVIDSDSDYAYVTNPDDGTVSVINTLDDTLKDTISAGIEPVGLALIPES
jgi:YVTN family beta-propeller protein